MKNARNDELIGIHSSFFLIEINKNEKYTVYPPALRTNWI